MKIKKIISVRLIMIKIERYQRMQASRKNNVKLREISKQGTMTDISVCACAQTIKKEYQYYNKKLVLFFLLM